MDGPEAAGSLQLTVHLSECHSCPGKKTVIKTASLALTFVSKLGHCRLTVRVNYLIAWRPQIHLGLHNGKNFPLHFMVIIVIS